MVREEIIKIIQLYLKELAIGGIEIKKAILFGSHVKNNYHENSDIDLLLISPLFDRNYDELLSKIWYLTKSSGYLIEPIPVGEKKFNEDDVSPLLEIIRREGVEIEYE